MNNMTAGNKIPKIRFQEFSSEWEQLKAEEIFETVDDRRHPELPVLAASQELGMVQRNKINYDISYDKKNAVTYKHVMPGQFVIHLRSFQGGFAHSDTEGITSPAYTVMDFKEKERHDDYYWKYVFSSDTFIKRLESVTYGVRDGRSISYDDFKKLEFRIPDNNEQRKIGEVLNHLNTLTIQEEKKYKKILDFKNAMLNKMFPEEGKNIPEMRFKGFCDSWKLKTLAEISLSVDYGLNASATEYDGKNKYLRITDIDDENRQFSCKGLTSPHMDVCLAKNYLLEKGDILFARTGASAGKTYVYKESDGIVYFAGFLIRMKIDSAINHNFIFYNTLTERYQKYIMIISQRSGQPGVNAQEYGNFEVMIPCREEQDKIAEYFSSFDQLIIAQRKRLEILQNIKNAMIDKMFI